MCGDGCNCSARGAHLTVIDGGKPAKLQPEHVRMDGSDLYNHLVAKSLLIYQNYEDEELSRERALGYLTAMEDMIKAAWGEENDLCHSIQKLIKDVEYN